MKLSTLLRMTPLLLAPFVVSACDEMAPEEGHHPHSAKLFVGGTELTPDIVLVANGPVRVEVRFFAEDGDDISDAIEVDHFTSLTFTPGTLATVTDVLGASFQKNLAVGAPATGTVTIGYGHDAAADEESFGPFTVTVR